MKQNLMIQPRLNLWPLLPFAIITLALLAARFVPQPHSEQASQPSHWSGQGAFQ